MNIPGLDAPSWSRNGASDALDHAEEEEKARLEWEEQTKSGKGDVKFTPAAASAAAAAASASSASSVAPLACDVLVLACGMMSASFLATLVDSARLQEIGRFTMPSAVAEVKKQKNAPAEGKDKNAMLLLRVAGDAASSTVFALNYAAAALTAPQYYAFTEALFERVQPKQVLLLDTLPIGAYISSERTLPSPPLLRRLQSSHFKPAAASSVPELEAPNLCFGFAASALTHCEVSQLPAQLFVSIESRHYIVECFAAFEQLFPSLLAEPEFASSQLHTLAKQFLALSEGGRTKSYKTAAAAMQRDHAYSAGSDSSVRETAAQVQRDNRDAMFF